MAEDTSSTDWIVFVVSAGYKQRRPQAAHPGSWLGQGRWELSPDKRRHAERGRRGIALPRGIGCGDSRVGHAWK